MSQRTKLILKILSANSDRNIDFEEMVKLIQGFEFSLRIKGSHYIFFKDGIEEIINLQPLKDGKAKAYQVKQIRDMIIRATSKRAKGA